MMAREALLPWAEVEVALNQLKRASQQFDCESVLDILKSAPTGFAPNGDVSDLVWCNGNEDQISQSKNTDKVRRLPLA